MILIDEAAEGKLASALEALRISPDGTRYVYFKLAGKPPIDGFRGFVVDAARRRLALFNPSIFMCEDGDVVILAATLPGKDVHSFILDVAGQAAWQISEQWVAQGEVRPTIATLLDAVNQKINARRTLEAQAREQARRAMELQQAQSKRQSILSAALPISSAQIQATRSARPAPQLMMIEDDAFSCKLVENVLQKRFAILALNEATHALDTYARIAPDLLFLDINLPDVTGHELLERIMEMDPNAYVVMLSGNADRDNIMQAMKLGAKGFVAKPFTREKLVQYLDRCPTIKADVKSR